MSSVVSAKHCASVRPGQNDSFRLARTPLDDILV